MPNNQKTLVIVDNFAKYYAKQGAKIFITARRADLLEELAYSLNSGQNEPIVHAHFVLL